MSPPAGSFLSDAFKLPFSARIAHTHTFFFLSPAVQHFSELLDDLSQDALLGQLLSDPFLSGGRAGAEAMEGEDGGDLSPSSPLPPHITAEHSYSLCGDSRPQSPLSHLTGEQGSDAGEQGTPVGKGFCSLCSYHSSKNYSHV